MEFSCVLRVSLSRYILLHNKKVFLLLIFDNKKPAGAGLL